MNAVRQWYGHRSEKQSLKAKEIHNKSYLNCKQYSISNLRILTQLLRCDLRVNLNVLIHKNSNQWIY